MFRQSLTQTLFAEIKQTNREVILVNGERRELV